MSEWMFVRRVLIVFAIGALVASLWVLSDIVLLVFGAALVAVVLRTLMVPIANATGMGDSGALAASVTIIICVIGALVVPFGSMLIEQIEYLIQQLPLALGALTQPLNLGHVSEAWQSSAIGNLASKAVTWGSTIFGAAASFVLVLVGGIYFAASPGQYHGGLITLFPERWHKIVGATIDDASYSLGQWVRAQVVAMAIVGTMMGVGMWLIGVPSALALGLFAGLMEFVPIVGPIVGAIPAVLLASSQSGEMALWAFGIAVLIQQVENFIIAPIVVGHVVKLPPAVGLFAVVAIGVLFGPLGLLLGYPLAIVFDVAIRRLYVRETLGERVTIPAERAREGRQTARS
jgi:predicted PurR-regulated permease PerM